MGEGTALQLCPFGRVLEEGLTARFETVRWFELSEAEQSAWLDARAADVRAVVTGGHLGLGSALMRALPSLGIVAVNGVGVDQVDLELARSLGIHVTTTPNTLTEDTADLAVGLIIGVLRGIPAADAYVRSGRWPQGDPPLSRKVSGRRFGIVGLGRIGSAVAARLAPFGPVAYTGPHEKRVPYEFRPELLDLAEASDVLVLTCPANASTHHLINSTVLDALGAQGYLINVARGALVDEPVLMAALEAGKIAGAGLDVYAHEPDVPAALRASSRVVLTPHVASATVETRRRMAELVLENLDAFIAGNAPPTAVL